MGSVHWAQPMGARGKVGRSVLYGALFVRPTHVAWPILESRPSHSQGRILDSLAKSAGPLLMGACHTPLAHQLPSKWKVARKGSTSFSEISMTQLSILLEHGLDSIPTHSTNKLHKTVYKTVNFPWSTFLWSVSHERGLHLIPTHSTNKLHETVYKMVNLPSSTFLWSISHGRGLNSIPTHSTNMLHKAIYKMVEFPSRTLIVVPSM
ncbi:uncharacterized protein LACBIDRAFT_335321 [Laccaria bicolor S238N-H82]|uniref:Predicted protein n=1 Tax=Laccaria bicolor (strain S238N-H82 / ATCC MYA-4686) TaxID=486041 RepID=B0E1Z8_LACBS|nr:uncharacterized protein LACBIDRAFT_335321 [Laccaria bicolor S238N-H82]EDQ99142.1 predicted protein [Laccaria bicolor S238N-H82]|eukprot:XP_001890205.1 predicted protein [Laccaria bicolor S238N-H82]